MELVYPVVANQPTHSYDLPGDELTQKGRNLRGVYIPVGKMMTWKVSQLTNWVVKIGANAVILDMKDDRGRVTFTRELRNARKPAHGFVRHMPKLIKSLQEKGVYIIGRIVCFKDNQLARYKTEAAIRDRRDGKAWRDRSGIPWLDPYSPLARDFITSVAVAAQGLGIDEVQLDYVRFPVEPEARYARYPNRDEKLARYEAIATLLAKVDETIDIPLSIDVFGLTAYNEGDPDGLGQSLEHLAPYIDAISPMLYLANWPRKAWEDPKPSRTRALVHNAVKHIRKRLGDHIAVRPLLQAFRYRAQNFGEGFIFNQIDAAETAGSSGHLFWNQSGTYGHVATVWHRLGLTSHVLSPRARK